jgi:hypothetical protein
MSKLFDALVVHNQTRVAPPHRRLSWNIDHTVLPREVWQQHIAYEISAQVNCRIVLPEGQEEAAKRRAWQNINQFVYGEFRDDIMSIRSALYEYDVEEAKVRLEALHERMFN